MRKFPKNMYICTLEMLFESGFERESESLFFSERKSIRSKIFNEHKGNDRQYNSFCT